MHNLNINLICLSYGLKKILITWFKCYGGSSWSLFNTHPKLQTYQFSFPGLSSILFVDFKCDYITPNRLIFHYSRSKCIDIVSIFISLQEVSLSNDAHQAWAQARDKPSWIKLLLLITILQLYIILCAVLRVYQISTFALYRPTEYMVIVNRLICLRLWWSEFIHNVRRRFYIKLICQKCWIDAVL